MARLTTKCPVCRNAGNVERIPVRLSRNGAVRVSCSNGHSIALIVQHPRFDILAEIACQAIIDGYPREAVASFQASLERFYEFFFFMLSEIKGIPENESRRAWACVSRQSERQLGLYVSAYLFHFGEMPPLLSNRMREFRNRVIHQGDIPDDVEATEFGQAVLDTNYSLVRQFCQQNLGPMMRAVMRDVGTQADFAQPGDVSVNGVWRLIYSHNVPGPPEFDLAAEIERRKAR